MLHTAFMSNILANYLTALSIILPNILAVTGDIKYIGAGLASVGI